MSEKPTGQQIRETILRVIEERSKMPDNPLNSGSIIRVAARQLGIQGNRELETALMSFLSDLFRTGYLAWGHDLNNTDPPNCHITEQGRRALEHISHDPANPDGYLAYLKSQVRINPIAYSYIVEGLKTFNSDCYKASAVMVGAASESMILELRDILLVHLGNLGVSISSSSDIRNRNIHKVLLGIQNYLTHQKKNMNGLSERFEAHWGSFTGQIRISRNEAGHPSSIDPVTPEQVYASLLIFPELAKLAYELMNWIPLGYK